jgi:hypothetical protein
MMANDSHLDSRAWEPVKMIKDYLIGTDTVVETGKPEEGKFIEREGRA